MPQLLVAVAALGVEVGNHHQPVVAVGVLLKATALGRAQGTVAQLGQIAEQGRGLVAQEGDRQIEQQVDFTPQRFATPAAVPLLPFETAVAGQIDELFHVS